MAGNPTKETRGHKLLKKWIAADPDNRGKASIAKACHCSRTAVHNWLSKGMRPRAEHRTILRLLAGISEDAWLLPEDRKAQRDAKRLSSHERAA
jgi:hypothetical protein